MIGTVPVLFIIFMAVSCVAGFTIPVILIYISQKKKHADIFPFFIGCAVMLVFALILESAVHQIVFGSSTGETIRNNIWLYTLYVGLIAGLFEETGRFIAFKTVLRKKRDKDVNALMYGAGHSGRNTSALTGALSGDALTQMEAVIETLTSSPSYIF